MLLGCVCTPSLSTDGRSWGAAIGHHHDPGVYAVAAGLGGDVDRVRMAADPFGGLEHGDLVLSCRRCAADSPETPAPTIAIFIFQRFRHGGSLCDTVRRLGTDTHDEV